MMSPLASNAFTANTVLEKDKAIANRRIPTKVRLCCSKISVLTRVNPSTRKPALINRLVMETLITVGLINSLISSFNPTKNSNKAIPRSEMVLKFNETLKPNPLKMNPAAKKPIIGGKPLLKHINPHDIAREKRIIN